MRDFSQSFKQNFDHYYQTNNEQQIFSLDLLDLVLHIWKSSISLKIGDSSLILKWWSTEQLAET